MFAYNWIKNKFISTLEYTGLKKKKILKFVVLGIDDVGKTTLILRLIPPEKQIYRRNSYRQQVYLESKNIIHVVAQDATGRRIKTWDQYLNNVNGFIYMVDSSNKSRFNQNIQLFNEILKLQDYKNIPIAVLGNKIDKMAAVPQSQIRQVLGIQPKQSQKWKSDKSIRPIEVFMCSIAKKMGYMEGINWLQDVVK